MDPLLQKMVTGLICCLSVIALSTSHCMFHSASAATDTVMKNQTDRLALLEFKKEIAVDPFQVLSSWNGSLHFCQWPGVACGRKHHQRVTALYLTDLGLVGRLSPYLANLTFLRSIRLYNNSFHGEIPHQLGSLLWLKLLNLSFNSLEGKIPTNFSNCLELTGVDFSYNKLVGSIPSELGSLPKLSYLGLYMSNLGGIIPPSLGNVSFLTVLALGGNNLQGRIPEQLGQLSRLQVLYVDQNNLSGTIPPSVFNLTNMKIFDVFSNKLSGQLPSHIGIAFPKLEFLYAGENHFTGPIPVSLSNASHLQKLHLLLNFFTGSIPIDIGKCQNLTMFKVAKNYLGSEKGDDLSFITSLTNCSGLKQLVASNNYLHGLLPDSIGNLSSQLQVLALGGNRIYGTISPGIENLVNLQVLGLESNLLTGSVPVGVGNYRRLEVIYIYNNSLSGQIPASLGNLSLLDGLYLSGNLLQGLIPPSLVNCSMLKHLYLSDNCLTGVIPSVLFDLTSLIALDLSSNSLSGSLPVEVSKLINLYLLHIANNQFFGSIPDSLGSCLALEILDMAGNSFTGAIPMSLNALKIIQNLDLSRNKLSGTIPDFIARLLYLKFLNLSSNNLEGEVPMEGIFMNETSISLEGNNKLCGGMRELKLPPCSTEVIDGHRRAPSVKLNALVITGSLIFMMALGLFAIYCTRKSRKKPLLTSCTSCTETSKFMKISYFELAKATDGFSSTNLMGTGSFGSVYKGILGNNQTVFAVKVLKLDTEGSLKSFTAECEALRNIRHRNLVKIFTSCSGLDAKGKEFKALVYEYMPNGTLESWLHPQGGENKFLNLHERLSIAIDVANALDYLHDRCHAPIVHCDLKPNNILLDEEMVAHVSDFGLAKVLFTESCDTSLPLSCVINIRGTIGYIPPEYGTGGEVTTMGDVYSFGVLLLEMLTGKKPTDDMFKDGLTISKHAEMEFPERVMEIVDPQLLLDEGKDGLGKIQDSLVSVIRIGIICSSKLPKDRMDMRMVTTELHRVREAFLGDQIKSQKT